VLARGDDIQGRLQQIRTQIEEVSSGLRPLKSCKETSGKARRRRQLLIRVWWCDEIDGGRKKRDRDEGRD